MKSYAGLVTFVCTAEMHCNWNFEFQKVANDMTVALPFARNHTIQHMSRVWHHPGWAGINVTGSIFGPVKGTSQK